MRAAVCREVPGGLALAERDRAAVLAGRLEHAERQRVDVGDRQRLCVVRRSGELRRRLETPEDVRLLEDHSGGAFGGTAERFRIRRPAVVRHLDDLEAEARCVRLDHLPHLRVRRLGDDDLRPAGRVLRDEAGVRSHSRAVVAGGVRDVHPRELADRGLVLEDRLQHALAHLGLVRRVRGQELAALHHGVDVSRDVMVVDAAAEKRHLLRRVDIPRRELGEVRHQLLLGERRLEVERAVEADTRGDVAEQLVDRRDADRLEHLLPVVVGESEKRVGHWSARTCL